MRLFNIIRKSFFLKIVCFTTLLSFIPYVLLGCYSLIQVHSLSSTMANEQIQKTITNVLMQKLALLEKETEINNAEFTKIEHNLKLIRKQAEYLFAKKSDFIALRKPTITLQRDPKGYFFYPDRQNSRFFLSALTPITKNVQSDLEIVSQLEPLLKETVQNEPGLKAAFFGFAEFGFFIYPPINAEYEVSTGRLPPDIRIQQYEFYYIADAEHNPERAVKWTRPYEDVTHWKWVVTAVIPVYSPNGVLQGVIGVDFPLDRMVRKFLDFTFTEPNAFAFIVDENGHMIASNQPSGRKLSTPLPGFGSSSDAFKPYIEKMKQKKKGIVKMATAEGNAYLLFANIPSSRWMMSFYIPEADIANPIIAETKVQISSQMKQFVIPFLFFLFVGAFLLIFFSYRFSRTVTEPVKNLAIALKQSGKGHYHQEIPITSQDEIGNLTKTFNRMSQTIEQLIAELKKRANELEEKVGERTKELQEANTKLTEMYEKLKGAEQARAELIAQVSHDLKTPLTTIKGYLQALHKYEFPPEKEREFIRTIPTRINHTIQLIDDLFELSSLHMDQLSFQKEWINLDFLIDYALEMVIAEFAEPNIDVYTSYEPELPLVFVDPAKINRALVNILSNAVKYSREKEKIRIEIACYQKGEVIITEIKDNGMGISEENMEKIFTMFYREPKMKEAKITGSGLGTSIAKGIIEKHNGTISITTNSDVGTTIIISLPVMHMEKEDSRS
ncbi:Cache domain-containing protein [Aneurinibacillus thermoaerophilus]|uniref:histidine kinase n=2 Tax=Aneurinibacillus thermoaerophilus TaxID=143495 RepID=A0A1G7XYU5_ANETH|nr:Cache domain-containing protein [Aneurinibacillus thermoaerophilus]